MGATNPGRAFLPGIFLGEFQIRTLPRIVESATSLHGTPYQTTTGLESCPTITTG